MNATAETSADDSRSDFIREIVEADLAGGRHDRIVTRFPPEPNGYPHVGHAKAICLNFGIAEQYGGTCHLRFDDTNPETEDVEYVEAIKADIRWLGFDWAEHLYFASDYYEQLYDYAEQLVQLGKAYVCDLTEREIRAYRGTVTSPGRDSPGRQRTAEENLDLLRRMRGGEFTDGSRTLRARIDMASANMKMRDPLLYRIRHAHHYRRGDAWCIYPMYDYAHCLSDSIERVTHSLCTLEFENNRELYDWILEQLPVPRPRPRQFEFARLNLSYTIVSKRKLLELVEDGHVSGWDDPRMPTLRGMKRRGYTPEAIRAFCERIGVTRANSVVDVDQLEHAVRDDLNQRAPRVLAVLRPLEVVIDNYPEGLTEELEAPFFPHDIAAEGSRPLPFSRRIFIERSDFEENPPKGFRRLAPGREVRLRYAYLVRCVGVEHDPSGRVTRLHCTYDAATRGGHATDGRQVQGTIHWVSAERSVPCEVRLYDRLFSDIAPDRGKGGPGFKTFLNPHSLEQLTDCRIEPSVAQATAGEHFQLERHGYFVTDLVDSRPGALVLNRTVPLKDTWTRQNEPTADGASRGPRRRRARRPETAPATSAQAATVAPRATAALEARFQHYRDELGLREQDAALLTDDAARAALFDAASAELEDPQAIANWILNELQREAKGHSLGELRIDGASLATLVKLVQDGTLSSTLGKEVLAEMLHSGASASAIVERRGLRQIADSTSLAPLVDAALADHPAEVEAYRAGKLGLFGFFVGQVMKGSQGKAKPQEVQALLRQRLGSAKRQGD